MRSMWSVSFVVAASLLGACWAEPLSQDRFGGTLELPDRSPEAMNEAEKLMVAHCGADNWLVEGWDEVVVDRGATRAASDDQTRIHLYYSCLKPTSPL